MEASGDEASKVERRRRERAEEVGCGEGPSTHRERGLCPLPRKLFDF